MISFHRLQERLLNGWIEKMIVNEDYPITKLGKEYLTYCAVGIINVAVMFLLYYWFERMVLVEKFPAASAWALSYLISSWQAHFLHRWLTFESLSPYSSSLIKMLIIYGVFWIISTASIAYFSDTLGFNHIIVFFANQLFFGFLSFVCLRLIAFPLSDGTISPIERLENARNRRRA